MSAVKERDLYCDLFNRNFADLDQFEIQEMQFITMCNVATKKLGYDLLNLTIFQTNTLNKEMEDWTTHAQEYGDLTHR
jgi:hypothetical protein